jgi:hypothetical protein
MKRLPLAAAAAALAWVACADNSAPTRPIAAGPEPDLNFLYYYGGDEVENDISAPVYDYPWQAYQDARSALGTACDWNQACIDDSVIAIYPKLEHWTDELETHGYQVYAELMKEQVQRIHSFFSNPDNNARGVDYVASMENARAVVSTWRSTASNAIEEVDELRDGIGDAQSTIIDQGEAYYGTEHGKLVRRRINLDRAQRAIDRYTAEIDKEKTTYGQLAADYKSFHAGEQTVIDSIADVITRANQAAIDQFGPLQAELVALAQSELTSSASLLTVAKRVRRRLELAQSELDARVEPLRDFLAEESIPVPELTGATIDNLDRMIRYIDHRVIRVNHKIAEILDRLQERRAALVRLAADQATQDTLRATAAANAATGFLAEANQQIDELWASGPYAGDIELLAPRYQKILAILQMEGMCSTDRRLHWMADGCNAINRNINKANSYLAFSLRWKVLSSASKFRQRGAADALVTGMQSAFDSGDLETALFTHDQIARDLEGL